MTEETFHAEGMTEETAAEPEPEVGPEPDARQDEGHEARARMSGQQMLSQLQQMIEQVATVAGPIVKDVAVKAAELAAVAGKAAGPFAHKVADATEMVGIKVASVSEHFAADLRSSPAGTEAGAEPPAAPEGGDEPRATEPSPEPISTQA